MYYSYYGFAYLQNWVANTILRVKKDNYDAEIVAMTLPMRLKPVRNDPFSAVMYLTLPYFIMLMFIPMVYRFTYRIVKEKELRTKELMTMMGMNILPYWLSWFAYFTLKNTVLSTVAWSVLYFACMTYASGWVLWFAIWIYGQSIFGFIMFFQSFFSSARSAAVYTTILYFGTAMTLNTSEQAPNYMKVLISLTPTACMRETFKVIMGFELHAMSIGLHDMHRNYRNFSVLLGFVMFLVSFILLNVLGIYLEAVIPRQYGKRSHPCFCLEKCKKTKPMISN
jgi:ATP-binding cassette subfamily A (ABC1) protein 3